MNMVFLIDEHTDTGSTEIVRSQADIVMDALRNSSTLRPLMNGLVVKQYNSEYLDSNLCTQNC